jgi:hypothetical protein
LRINIPSYNWPLTCTELDDRLEEVVVDEWLRVKWAIDMAHPAERVVLGLGVPNTMDMPEPDRAVGGGRILFHHDFVLKKRKDST